jgi:hypothetical protein
MDRLEEDPGAAPMAAAFRAQIWVRLPRWRESLLDITEILKAYLYRLRQVEPAGRRLRAFNLFLRRNPDYTAPDIEELTEPPTWARRAAGLRLAAHPDLQDAATNEALIEVAARLPPSPTVIRRPPKVGTLIPGADTEPRVLTLAPRPDQLALRRLLAAVPPDGAPLSVRDWKREHPEYADLPDAIWLHCVLYEATLARRRTGHIRFERLELPPPRSSAPGSPSRPWPVGHSTSPARRCACRPPVTSTCRGPRSRPCWHMRPSCWSRTGSASTTSTRPAWTSPRRAQIPWSSGVATPPIPAQTTPWPCFAHLRSRSGPSSTSILPGS